LFRAFKKNQSALIGCWRWFSLIDRALGRESDLRLRMFGRNISPVLSLRWAV